MKTTCEHCHQDVEYNNGDRHQQLYEKCGQKIVDYYYIICSKCKNIIRL